MNQEERYTIRTRAEFESSHSIREYIEDPDNPGHYLDEPLHGHSWVVEAFASSRTVEERTGFAIDFMTLKGKVEELASYLGHQNINNLPPFDKTNPSTENIAKWFYQNIREIIPEGSTLSKVRVWEGPHNFAEYSIEE